LVAPPPRLHWVLTWRASGHSSSLLAEVIAQVRPPLPLVTKAAA
jgi:hypothetical protein